MRFLDTNEMIELRKIFEPYQDDRYNLIKESPKEVLDAYSKYLELSKEQERQEIASLFD